MSGALGLGAILFAATLLAGLLADGPIAGLQPNEILAVGTLCATALVMAGWTINDFRQRWSDGVRALLVWSIVFAALISGYARRDELSLVLDRVIGEIDPGRTVTTDAGEVVVARRADGSFTLAGHVNDKSARFVFDTGASAVVLTAESAAASGFVPETLSFVVPVSTANGRTLAAPVTIDRITIGPIVERRIKALVAKPGVLHENLLGMTFLDRLASYEVRGNRLILRRPAATRGP
jgi:aspartyl protease family protein